MSALAPLEEVRKWGSFIKFSHTVFALPFALASMALAARADHGWPGWRIFLLVLAAMVTARTCAMAFNRIVDRDVDGRNPRTQDRHLPSGVISLKSAWMLWGLSAVGFVASAALLNPVCMWLSPVALFVVCFYSLTKRFTDFTHVYLGIALALSPIGAWLAVRGKVAWMPLQEGFLLPLLLSLVVILWIIGFDIIYAIQDHEFDVRNGLHSIVVRWGLENALKASFLSHVLMLMGLVLFGLLAKFKVVYFAGVFFIIPAVLFEHWLARRRGVGWINLAFFKLNAFISIVFMVAVLGEVVLGAFRWSR